MHIDMQGFASHIQSFGVLDAASLRPTLSTPFVFDLRLYITSHMNWNIPLCVSPPDDWDAEIRKTERGDQGPLF